MQHEQDTHILDLMREGAREALERDQTWVEPMYEAVGELFDIAEDTTASAAIRRYNLLSSTHFATSILSDPTLPVEAFIDPEIRVQLREQIRSGAPEAILNGYRIAQIVAWRAWMRLAFTLTDDKGELEKLLEFSAQQINDYSERSLKLLSDMVDEERAELANRSDDSRFQIVNSVLRRELRESKPASAQLGYALDRARRAVILWSRNQDADKRNLEAAADQVETAFTSRRSLRVDGKASALWLWMSVANRPVLDLSELDGGVQLAIGPAKTGLEGFIESHESALLAQRIAIKSRPENQVIRFEDVQLAHLLLEQPQCDEFVRSTLGRLFDAPAATKNCLRTYLEEGSNAAKPATGLGIHRNTLNQRLERAKDLLPERKLTPANRTRVAAALNVLRWS